MYIVFLLYYQKDIFENTDIRAQFFKQYKKELQSPTNWLEFNTITKIFTIQLGMVLEYSETTLLQI